MMKNNAWVDRIDEIITTLMQEVERLRAVKKQILKQGEQECKVAAMKAMSECDTLRDEQGKE